MKKFVVVLLALSMLLTLCACGKKEQESVLKKGYIDDMLNAEALVHVAEKHPDMEQLLSSNSVYSNLSAALVALEKGEISSLTVFESVANYVASHHDKYIVQDLSDVGVEKKKTCDFSMMTADTNAELHGILDSAIKQLKADGTLDQLIAEDLYAYIKTDPTPAELPKFDGAKTYKIAVTGDAPPMDFVTADGKAAGFNVALLTEIANIAQVNFETVPVDAGARITALTTGKVDAIFLMTTYGCFFCGEPCGGAPNGTQITETYFSDYVGGVALKPAE